MIPEIDIWRVAHLMLKRYGDLVEVESARRADELWEVGDAAGVVVGRRVMGAVRQLVNLTPPGRYTDWDDDAIWRARCEVRPPYVIWHPLC